MGNAFRNVEETTIESNAAAMECAPGRLIVKKSQDGVPHGSPPDVENHPTEQGSLRSEGSSVTLVEVDSREALAKLIWPPVPRRWDDMPASEKYLSAYRLCVYGGSKYPKNNREVASSGLQWVMDGNKMCQKLTRTSVDFDTAIYRAHAHLLLSFSLSPRDHVFQAEEALRLYNEIDHRIRFGILEGRGPEVKNLMRTAIGFAEKAVARACRDRDREELDWQFFYDFSANASPQAHVRQGAAYHVARKMLYIEEMMLSPADPEFLEYMASDRVAALCRTLAWVASRESGRNRNKRTPSNGES